jgi:hypothetical protein
MRENEWIVRASYVLSPGVELRIESLFDAVLAQSLGGVTLDTMEKMTRYRVVYSTRNRTLDQRPESTTLDEPKSYDNALSFARGYVAGFNGGKS